MQKRKKWMNHGGTEIYLGSLEKSRVTIESNDSEMFSLLKFMRSPLGLWSKRR